MEGVPEQFIDERDSARFRHLAQLPGVELYHAHISRYAFEPHTMKRLALARLNQVPSAFAIAGRSMSPRPTRSSP